MKKSIIFCVLIVIAISAFSDEVTLKDGRVFECEIIGKKGFDIFINSNGEFYKVDRGSIEDIIFEGKFMTDLIYLKNDFMKSYPKKLIILEADKNTMIKKCEIEDNKAKEL